MKKPKTKQERREKRRIRIRSRVIGTLERPRLNVFRSAMGMYLQLIDDKASRTLESVHSKHVKEASDAGGRNGKMAVAYQLGKALAEKAKAIGITTIVFDRAGYAYHGRVKAAAEGARDGGLLF